MAEPNPQPAQEEAPPQPVKVKGGGVMGPIVAAIIIVAGIAGIMKIMVLPVLEDNLCSQQPEYVNDFPHGGGRFVVKSQGYTATLVAGNVVVENCQHTGVRPGQVIREFARG